jgi:thioredoxin 1
MTKINKIAAKTLSVFVICLIVISLSLKFNIMNQLTDAVQFEQVLNENPLCLVYFSGENCNVCKSLKPKIEMLVEQQFPSVRYLEIKTEQAPLLSSAMNVFSVPVITFFVEGKEYIREARNISVAELADKMEKIVKLYEG